MKLHTVNTSLYGAKHYSNLTTGNNVIMNHLVNVLKLIFLSYTCLIYGVDCLQYFKVISYPHVQQGPTQNTIPMQAVSGLRGKDVRTIE